MKYYLVIFSDYSETVGAYNTKAEAERGARHYCELWNLAETVREVQEISAEEYSRRTGNPAPDPVKEEKPRKNRIPRKFSYLYFTMQIDTTAAKAGESVIVNKNQYNEYILTNERGETYRAALATLRNGDIMTLKKIDTEEAPKQPESDPETIKATETTPAENKTQEEPQRAANNPEAWEEIPLYIVQCRSPRRPWTDYSSPATLAECETIKARAEARRTCSVNGDLLTYRIIPTDGTPTAVEERPEPTPTAVDVLPIRQADSPGGRDGQTPTETPKTGPREPRPVRTTAAPTTARKRAKIDHIRPARSFSQFAHAGALFRSKIPRHQGRDVEN